MNKSTLSILMAALVATSGFASAQTPTTGPNTRADVKAQITPGDLKGGTASGEGPVKNMPAADSGGVPANSRAGVKAEVKPSDLKTSSEGAVKETPASKSGDMASKTRADVKAEVKPGDLKISKEGAVTSDTSARSSAANSRAMADRKAKRAERKAAAKAKRDARMNGDTPVAKPATSMGSEKPQ